jgi:hypothetical protein
MSFTSSEELPRFEFRLLTFDESGHTGLLSNLSTPRQWTILTSTEGITGFNASVFDIDATSFVNLPNKEAFSLTLSGDNKSLILNFNPAAVPEPSTWALLIAGLGIVGFASLRRKRT